MIYFDGVHLMANTLDELHAEARRKGLKREWFQNHPRHPHYDVLGALKKRFIVNCTTRQIIKATKGDRI